MKIMEVYTHLQSFKDSSGKIQKCVLRNDSTGKIGNYDRDIIMHNMKTNVWKVKGLMIDDAQRLRTTNKDEMIEEYKKACRTLGIAPVDIVVTNKDEYVVTDVPYNRVTKIPDFADGIALQKKFMKGQVNNTTQTNGSSSTNTKSSLDMLDLRVEALFKYLKLNIDKLVISSVENKTDVENLQQTLDSMQQTLLQSVGQLGSDINGLQSDLGQSSSDIEQKMTDIENMFNSLDSAIGTLATSTDVIDLKSDVLSNVRQLITSQTSAKQVLDDLNNKYSQFVLGGGFNQSKIKDFDKIPKFARVKTDEYVLSSQNSYNAFVTQNKPGSVLIPFNELMAMKDDIEYLYNTYTIFEEFFNDLKDEDCITMGDFVNCVNFLGEGANGVMKFSGKSTVKLNTFLDMFNKAVITKKGYNKAFSNFYGIYSNASVILDQFYCDKDEDILKFLFEYKILKKNDTGAYSPSFMWKKTLVHYRLIFRTLYEIGSKRQLTISDGELVKRIAVAYIVSEKLLNQKITTISLTITPHYITDSENTRFINAPDMTIEQFHKYMALYKSIHYVLMHSFLVYMGIEPELSYNVIISTMKELDPRSIIDLDVTDVLNLTFDYTHYETRLKGV